MEKHPKHFEKKSKKSQGKAKETSAPKRKPNSPNAKQTDDKSSFSRLSLAAIVTLGVISIIVYIFYETTEEKNLEKGPLLDIIEEANSSICDEFAYQVGDGLCDDNVNIEMCQFDGGDCCLDKKLTPLCKNCTCKMNFDEDVLKADLNRSDVKVFVEMADYNDVLVNEDVMAIDDVESVNVCSSLCFGEASGATTKVNGWSYDYATAKCSCSWLSATLCLVIEEDDMTSIDEGQDSKKLEGSVGFVALSKTLKCGTFLSDIGPAIIGSNPDILKTSYQPSPWHCKLWCDAVSTMSSCVSYIWVKDRSFDGYLNNCAKMTMEITGMTLYTCQGAILGTKLTEILDDVTAIGYSNSENVILVTNGFSDPQSMHFELVHIDNTNAKCELPDDVPMHEFSNRINHLHMGVLGGNTPVICGGVNYFGTLLDDCLTLTNPASKIHGMQSRYHSASIILRRYNGSVLWITGGRNNNHVSQDTTELVSLTGRTVQGPSLPVAFFGHCLARARHANDSRILFISGGVSTDGEDVSPIEHTHIYDWDKGEWSPGPGLAIFQRLYSQCGGILDHGHGGYIIVAANGGQTGFAKTTEVIDARPEIDDWKWEMGPNMPVEIHFAGSCLSWDSKHLYVIGGMYDFNDLTTVSTDIYSISCVYLECQWSKASTQLPCPIGQFSAAVLMPDSLVETYCV